MPQLTWLVTGCSSGIGEQFVHGILARGDRVIATARNGKDRLNHLQDAGAAIFDLDVTASQEELNSKVEDIIKSSGGVDVIVNNAGYIEAGLVEEVSHEGYLDQFNTNTFGVINTTRAVLPHFRNKKSGVVVFIGSSGGWAGEPGAGPYCGTKFAIEGIFECLRQETAHLGIQSIIFELGFFRTKIMHTDNVKMSPSTIEDYAPVSSAVAQFVTEISGNQPGDPKKAVEIMVDVIKGEGVAAGKDMPERLPLGPDVLATIRKKCTATMSICDEWEKVITSTNFN